MKQLGLSSEGTEQQPFVNGVDKDHKRELYLDVPASMDYLAYCKNKYLHVLFSATMMLSPASLAVLSLTLGCACVCSCVGMSMSYV